MKILVPFDFSQESIYAAKLGEQLVNRTQAELKVLHCLNMPDYPYQQSESAKSLAKMMQIDAESSVKERINENLGHLPEVEVREGNPSSVILKENWKKEFRFTIMGYKEQKVPEKIGSTTRNILRFALGSVLTIKRELDLSSISNILIITDFLQTPVASIANVKFLQDLTGARIKLLYVNSRENWMTDLETYRNMETFCKVHDLKNVSLEIMNSDTLESGVLYSLSKFKVDLMALKINRSNNTLSTKETHLSAERIMDHTDIPVMTFAHSSIYS